MDQASHSILSDSAPLLLILANIVYCPGLQISILPALVHYLLHSQLLRLNQAILMLDLVLPAAHVELSASLIPSDPRLTLGVSLHLTLDRVDQRLPVLQVFGRLLPSLKPVVQPLMGQERDARS